MALAQNLGRGELVGSWTYKWAIIGENIWPDIRYLPTLMPLIIILYDIINIFTSSV